MKQPQEATSEVKKGWSLVAMAKDYVCMADSGFELVQELAIHCWNLKQRKGSRALPILNLLTSQLELPTKEITPTLQRQIRFQRYSLHSPPVSPQEEQAYTRPSDLQSMDGRSNFSDRD